MNQANLPSDDFKAEVLEVLPCVRDVSLIFIRKFIAGANVHHRLDPIARIGFGVIIGTSVPA